MKYFKCRARYGNGEEIIIFIKSAHDYLEGEEDDFVFYYGLSKIDILKMMKHGGLLDGEYTVLEIISESKILEEAI